MGNHTATRARGRNPAAGNPFAAERQARADVAARALFGHALTASQARALALAPAGALVDTEGLGRDALHITAAGGSRIPGFAVDLFVMRGETGRPQLFINDLRRGPLSWADVARLTRTQAAEARHLGIQNIGTKLAHFADEHQAFPRMGYDAPIEHALLESTDSGRTAPRIPAGQSGPRTLLEAMGDPAWRAWWDANGLTPGLTFDPAHGSASMRQLAKFVRGSTSA